MEISNPVILLIDDDESIRQVLSLALEFEGYRVHTASNGQEGIEVLHRIPNPFLILLDLMMPVLDGWGFISALSSMNEFNKIPIIIITAFMDKVSIPKNMEVIQKPVDLELLFSRLKEIRTKTENH